MEIERDFELGKEVLAEQDAVTGFHVEEFDGEDVSGTLELIAGKEERRVVSFLNPPFGDAVQGLHLGRAGALNQADDVEVGMSFVEFAGGRGAVEGDGL